MAKGKMSRGDDYGSGDSGTDLLKPSAAYCGPGRDLGSGGTVFTKAKDGPSGGTYGGVGRGMPGKTVN